jgi:hypothetical protein
MGREAEQLTWVNRLTASGVDEEERRWTKRRALGYYG